MPRPPEPFLAPVPAPARRSGGPAPVAIVTGANHGIGAATARTLAAAGARVLVTGLPIVDDRDPATPDAYYEARARHTAPVAAAISDAGGTATAVDLDLTRDDAAATLYDAAEEALGPVRILVHNATGWVGDSFAATATDDLGRGLRSVDAATFDQQFAVDARAGALLIAEHARRHRDRGDTWGRIVTLTSGGPGGFPGEASYGAAKAALDNYAMTAASELAPLGITVNALHPPVTDTGWVTGSVRDLVAGSSSLEHVATPEEVAVVIAWLCSDDAWLVSGNRLVLR